MLVAGLNPAFASVDALVHAPISSPNPRIDDLRITGVYCQRGNVSASVEQIGEACSSPRCAAIRALEKPITPRDARRIDGVWIARVKRERIEIAGRPTSAVIGALVKAGVSFCVDRFGRPRVNCQRLRAESVQEALVGSAPTGAATVALKYANAKRSSICSTCINGINHQGPDTRIG